MKQQKKQPRQIKNPFIPFAPVGDAGVRAADDEGYA